MIHRPHTGMTYTAYPLDTGWHLFSSYSHEKVNSHLLSKDTHQITVLPITVVKTSTNVLSPPIWNITWDLTLMHAVLHRKNYDQNCKPLSLTHTGGSISSKQVLVLYICLWMRDNLNERTLGCMRVCIYLFNSSIISTKKHGLRQSRSS